MNDFFSFEVPTSQGTYRIVGPSELHPDERDEVADRIARILKIAVLPKESSDGTPYVLSEDPKVFGMPR